MNAQRLAYSILLCTWAFLSFAEPFIPNSVLPRTICGNNDMIPISTTPQEKQTWGDPIGIYRFGNASCTGTLISENLFLTNRHCLSSCSNITVTFGYHGDEHPTETYRCEKIIEFGDNTTNHDYLIIQLESYPGQKWGWYQISNFEIPSGTPLLMIHHPSGSPMKISEKNCTFKKESNGFLYHDCDTNPGSSGSAILLPDYNYPKNSKIIGIHSTGNCTPYDPTLYNYGPSMNGLLKVSPLLQDLNK